MEVIDYMSVPKDKTILLNETNCKIARVLWDPDLGLNLSLLAGITLDKAATSP